MSATLYRFHAAVRQHLQHGGAALDCGTESLLDQVLPTPVSLLDTPTAAPSRHHKGYPLPQEPAMSPNPPAARVAPLEPADRAPQRIQRQHEAIAAASRVAHARGEQQGFCAGWRRGMLAGVVVGATLATIAWSVYLSIAAPEVAPPSATRPAVVQTAL